MAGSTVELGVTVLHCFTTPFGAGSALLRSNIISFTVVEMLTLFSDEQ